MVSPELTLSHGAYRRAIELKPHVPEDAALVAGLIEDDRGYIMPFDRRLAESASEETCRQRIEDYSAKHEIGLGVWANSTLVGSVELAPAIFDAEALIIGYWIGKKYSGRGFATEAARIATLYAFQILNQSRLIAYVHADNRPSQRVMEKAGYTRVIKSPIAKIFQAYEYNRTSPSFALNHED